MSEQRNRSIGEILADGTTINEALKRGVREALRRHKRLGESIAVWEDGKVVTIPSEQIDVLEEEVDESNSDSARTSGPSAA